MPYFPRFFKNARPFMVGEVPDVTETSDGLMSAADKRALDALVAGTSPYTPSDPADWDPVPNTTASALDQLAARVTALEAAIPATPETWTCPAGAAVGDLMSQDGDTSLQLADASDPAKMAVKGFIINKPSATTCVLQQFGPMSYAGLVADTEYYADPANPGGITAVVPDIMLGEVIYPIGRSISTDELDVIIAEDPPFFPS